MNERLTERVGDGIRYDNGKYIITCYPQNDNLTPVDKLAAKLCDLEDKIENGAVIVLPCKVGDKVFIPDDFGRIEAEIEIIEITEREVRYGWVKYDRGVDETEVWDNGDFSVSDIGKTVFLTFEEYEKAFAERSEGK